MFTLETVPQIFLQFLWSQSCSYSLAHPHADPKLINSADSDFNSVREAFQPQVLISKLISLSWKAKDLEDLRQLLNVMSNIKWIRFLKPLDITRLKFPNCCASHQSMRAFGRSLFQLIIMCWKQQGFGRSMTVQEAPISRLFKLTGRWSPLELFTPPILYTAA